MRVPLLDLQEQYRAIKSELMAAIEAVCDSQHFINGPKVDAFEAEAAQYCGCEHACGVSSGSDALLICLMAEGVGPGDEVITTPFSFFATAGAVSRVGAKPVFVDIEPRVFNLDPALIEAKITPATKAIIPVHLFGQTADMGPIMDLARKHKLLVIEDAAQAIGSEHDGKRAGSVGDYGCFSFFPSKNLGAFGDGGLVTTNTKERLDKLKYFRNHGANPKYYHKYIGGNFRLDALQAAVLSVKLPHLDAWSAARQANAAEYRELFAKAKLGDKIELPLKAPNATRHIYNQFCLLAKDGKRKHIMDALAAADIGCEIYYPVPLHLQECFADLGYKQGDMPVSERTAEEIFAIPIYPESTSAMRAHVVDTIAKALRG